MIVDISVSKPLGSAQDEYQKETHCKPEYVDEAAKVSTAATSDPNARKQRFNTFLLDFTMMTMTTKVLRRAAGPRN